MNVRVQDPQQRPYRVDGNGRDGDGAHVPAAEAERPPAAAAVATPEAPAGAPGPSAPAGRPATAPIAPAATVPTPAPRRRRRFLNRRVLLPIAAVIILVLAFVGFNAWRDSMLYVSTDNAQLAGQPVQVGSMNAGRVDSVGPNLGDTVRKGDVVAQLALPSQIGTAQNGQPKMGFLGSADSKVDVQAPIDGVVIAEPVAVGSNVQAGQAVVEIVDPSQLYVTANIEETSIARVKVGQPVTVHVDALNADVPGKVEAVTPATANTFSMLPTSNTSGNFTKVTQLIPVRISVNLGNQPTLLGANVEVKIRVSD
jgi:multidrug resistance efflux pump